MTHVPTGSPSSGYHRYHIPTKPAPDIEKWPSRFKVKVRRTGLAKLLLSEIVHYRGRKDVILSRPCMYGVFSGPVGGFMPREEHCVGCLRCTTEFPEFVRIEHNPERQKLGDSYFTFNYVDQIAYEASSGLVPVRGAGYRGKFGGEGWDGMWTDMSEIVRPTRDGIHGRETISTVVDIGYTPNFLQFDAAGQPVGNTPHYLSIQLPILFDGGDLPRDGHIARMYACAAAELDTLAVLPFEQALGLGQYAHAIVPVVRAEHAQQLGQLGFTPRMVEMHGWDDGLYAAIIAAFPQAIIALRTGFGDAPALVGYAQRGVKVFHLVADYHGRSADGRFVLDLIRDAHKAFVDAGIREEVTLLGSGGMIAAEHMPKAMICGLDAVAVDTPPLVALQARFEGECASRTASRFSLPAGLNEAWGVQRLKNLAASWRDQLLEILGAMGLREVRRLRGEMGRAMFMKTLEADAFAGLLGYSEAANG
ncbi:MAG: hypothetical protein KIT08_08705 [Anaerolineales bacterium]|nr:MAG: hypothetical protein KIT08_08705 [Anaerolineales bacterium]